MEAEQSAGAASDVPGHRLRERYALRGRGSEKGRKAGVHLIRYADDFVITGKTKELLEDEVRPLVESFLRERGLELSAEKAKITHIEEGFDFLGQNVRRYGHHVVPKVLGGHDGATNRQLLHPECHRQLHSRLGRLHRCVSQEAFGRLEPCELETLTHGS